MAEIGAYMRYQHPFPQIVHEALAVTSCPPTWQFIQIARQIAIKGQTSRHITEKIEMAIV